MKSQILTPTTSYSIWVLLAILTSPVTFATTFGPGAVFPDAQLVSYREKIGVVPQTQLHYAVADVTLRLSNNGTVPTDRMWINVKDNNVLMRSTAQFDLLSLGIGASKVVTIHLTAILPPGTSQLPEDQQYSKWNQQYQSHCGVDLIVTMDWQGPISQTPIDNHNENYLYLGYGDSKPWQQNRSLADTTICDDKNCVSITQASRNIYKRLGCNVVGYASFIGDRTSGPRGRFDTYGKARTSLNPPVADFAPTTKMQSASTSKVLTALAAMRVLGTNLDGKAYTMFPSNWADPPDIVKNITFRELLSHTSGVQQYYASASGQDYSSLQSFFTNPVPSPNAPRSCPGSCTAPPPGSPPGTCGSRQIPNRIVTDKTPCYTDTNFGIMRLLLPRYAHLLTGGMSNDPAELASQYVTLVNDKVFAPVGVKYISCMPPLFIPTGYALLYKYPGDQISGDWQNLTSVCGDWGWYVSVEEYAKVLVSLNSADHKILTNCQLSDMENNPANHPLGWDIKIDKAGRRLLEKNGADGMGNGAVQTTSVAIYGGRSMCFQFLAPISGVVGVLFINSNIANQVNPNLGAWDILIAALQSATRPKL